MAKLIVIEGLDGSGKATQAELLFKALSQKKIPARKISFPDYSDESSAPAKMYLDGKFGNDADLISPYVASVFFTVNRYASYQLRWKEDYLAGTVIVADRYTTSNIVHQMSKLKESCWDEFLNWIHDFEYEKFALPRPDLVIYLDIKPRLSARLLTKRYKGQKLQDLHERNIEYLNRCRRAALYAAEKLHWNMVKCFDSEQLFSLEEISNRVNTEAFKFLKGGEN